MDQYAPCYIDTNNATLTCPGAKSSLGGSSKTASPDRPASYTSTGEQMTFTSDMKGLLSILDVLSKGGANILAMDLSPIGTEYQVNLVLGTEEMSLIPAWNRAAETLLERNGLRVTRSWVTVVNLTRVGIPGIYNSILSTLAEFDVVIVRMYATEKMGLIIQSDSADNVNRILQNHAV